MLDFFLFLTLFFGVPLLLLYIFLAPVIRTFTPRIFYQPSVQALIAANAYTLLGVIFLDWSLFNVICLFWLENIIVGFFNVLRMRRAQGPLTGMELNGKTYTREKRPTLIRFFLLHYGGFTFVHGVFVFTLFGSNGMSLAEIAGIASGFIALFISHRFSYVENYIGKKEYHNVSEEVLFTEPYTRMMVLHMTVIIGGIFAGAGAASVFAVVLLIILKTVLDVMYHIRERKEFSHAVFLSTKESPL